MSTTTPPSPNASVADSHKYGRAADPHPSSPWSEGRIETAHSQGGADETHNGPSRVATNTTGSFSLTLIAASVLALLAAVIIAPVVAVAAASFRFPFPRIFDRTVMVTLLASLLLFARRLTLLDFL